MKWNFGRWISCGPWRSERLENEPRGGGKWESAFLLFRSTRESLGGCCGSAIFGLAEIAELSKLLVPDSPICPLPIAHCPLPIANCHVKSSIFLPS
ncbi:hypothetical protein PVK06_038777 [Gossypium arboreum]|uniref:Uncharacterized protein n=1 Tax=Gossypium arboreum TaxID=29729 RepID=A0ABR0N117_GOSAR|nr:hypothetical protein PVK06_038777 [Gossypium arboreum]